MSKTHFRDIQYRILSSFKTCLYNDVLKLFCSCHLVTTRETFTLGLISKSPHTYQTLKKTPRSDILRMFRWLLAGRQDEVITIGSAPTGFYSLLITTLEFRSLNEASSELLCNERERSIVHAVSTVGFGQYR